MERIQEVCVEQHRFLKLAGAGQDPVGEGLKVSSGRR